jgi:stage II sporulation protein D
MTGSYDMTLHVKGEGADLTRRRVLAWLALAAGTGAASCLVPRAPETTPRVRGTRLPAALRVRVSGRVLQVPIEAYVLGTTLAEVSPVGEAPAAAERILEVQTILARTYAAAHLGRHASEGFDLCDTTHCQVYQPDRIRTSRFTTITEHVIERTHGTVIVFNGRPIDALFHADCGGRTAAAADVWHGTPVPYLVGGPDVAPDAHRHWQFTTSLAALGQAVDADSRSRVGRLTAVAVAGRDASGRARDVELRGARVRVVRGVDFRAIADASLGERALLSTRFTIARQGPSLTFTGTGYGHGVGLCQLGAAIRARRGDSPAAILAAYYPGTALTRADTP